MKKNRFQIEIEQNERRLDEIYNRIFGIDMGSSHIEIDENGKVVA